MEKRIKDFEDYTITPEGDIYSYKNGKKRLLTKKYCTNGYVQVHLCKNNKVYKKLLHRLVAETYIPNPNNLPCVDHIDANIQNNNVDNLQWITTKDNIHKSYKQSGIGATRNYVKCFLVFKDTNEHIKSFDNIKEACRYASKKFKVSFTSLEKYRQSGNIKLILKRCRD